MPVPRRVTRVLLALVFFCSGAFGLIYEVIWQRQFALLFGSGAPATAVVLAAYFAGLGVGSIASAKWRPPWHPLITYAILEFAVAAGALLVTPLLGIYSGWYSDVISTFGKNGGVLLVIKGGLALAAIAIPTVAMGATLPVLAELVDGQSEDLGVRVGWLYAVNTAGAALGAATFPFVLLRLLGSHGTVLFCAAGNVAIAVAALWMRKGWEESSATAKPSVSQERREGQPRTLLWLAFASGAGTFALQVLWNRAFAQVHENSIYAFALIATTFIAAIALGVQAARWLLRKGVSIDRAFGAAWITGGLAAGFCPALFVALTGGLAYAGGSTKWSGLAVLGTGVIIIIVPVGLLSMGLPLLLGKAGVVSQRNGGEVVGTMFAANIGGAIVGALVAGFGLPVWLGVWNAIIFTGAVFAACGAWLGLKSRVGRAAAVAGVSVFAWLLASRDLPRVRLDSRSGESLVAVKEGAYGIAVVTERAGSRRLKLNNHYTLGGTFATGDERLQAHIPLLLHPAPRRAVFLGFGTGITAGGALYHPKLKIQAIELVPEVAELAAKHFAQANGFFHTQTNTTLIIDDARNFLRSGRDKFDVIVSDIVVPWQPGEAALYTVEHFNAARRSLNTNGVFCVWLPLFQMDKEEFHILARTFLSVFGRAQLWRGDFSPTRPALALVAGARPDAETIERRISEMASDPANPHLRTPQGVWMYFVGTIVSEDVQETRINSEDRPWLELLAPPGEGTRRRFVGPELARWEASLSPQVERSLSQSATAGAGYRGGRLMVEWTQAMFDGKQQRAAEIREQIRTTLGEQTDRLIFSMP